MKKKILTIILTVVLACSYSIVYADDINADVDTKDMLNQSEYKKGELIVIFDDDLSNRAIKNVVANEDATCKDIIDVSEDSKASIVKISSEDTMYEAIEKFKDNEKVQYVQPNYKYNFYDNDSVLPDPKYQYYIGSLRISEVWDLIEAHDYTTTKVAVLDTGVDVYHEDLQANLTDTTGYVQAVEGNENIIDYDTDEHGTHVSGIIGATYGNNIGVTGVASGHNNDLVDVMVVGTTPDGYYLYTADIVQAINYAKDHGAQVMNMSFGGEGRDRAMEAAVRDAYNAGIVMVAAAGNEESDVFNSPSDFKEVISVNASNRINDPTYWSNYGLYKDISAPGNNILSTVPGDSYEYSSGTSMASPVVTGIVALVLDANPNLTPAQVYNILCASTGTNDFDNYLAYGIVNPLNAVTAAYEASASTSVDVLSIKTENAEVYVGDDIYLETLIRPATSLKSVTWTSLDPDIASVDSVTGKVTGLSEGVAAIKGAVDGREVVCMVSVKDSVAQEGITITNKEKIADLFVGDYDYIDAVITPANATNKEIYYYSSDRQVLNVYTEDGTFEALKTGTVTVTAKTFDGKYSDSITVTVHPNAAKVEMLSTPNKSKLLVGDTFTYEARALDEDGNEMTFASGVTWASTNSTIAKINKYTGQVTALKAGTVYISATANANSITGVDVMKAVKLTVGKTNYTGSDYNLRLVSRTYDTARLAWNSIPVASSYVVERSSSLNFATIDKTYTTTYTSYTDKNLKAGKTYYYRVKAKYDASRELGYSDKKSVSIIVNKPTITLNNSKKKTLVVSWKKVAGANGYTVYRSTTSNGTYKSIKTVTGLSYSNTNLVSGKKFFYKVKAYRLVDGKKVYSAYSNALGKVVK